MTNPKIDYEDLYPRLAPMRKGSRSNIFGDGRANHVKPLVTRVPKTVLPGLRSFDPDLLGFQRKLSFKINDEVGIDLNDQLFSRTGNFSSADSLRTVAGYMMNPMSYTPRDNAEYRDSLGLKPAYTARERAIAKNVWRHIFKAYKPGSIKVSKGSGSGPPRNTHDAEWKARFGEWILRQDRLEGALKAMEAGDFAYLRNTYEIFFLMTIQKRDQVDTPGKVREAYDRTYAISNGKRGGLHNADKTVVIDGVVYEDFSATRARVVHAGPWVVNVILSMLSSGTMRGLFERYPKVFHVNTADQVTDLINGSEIFCGDVKEYDRSMSQDALDVVHEAAAEYWDSRLVNMSKYLYHSAYYSRPLELDGEKGVLIGNYENYQAPQVRSGNRSGHAWTSLVAKGNKVVDSLLVFDKIGLPVLDNEETYLLGNGAMNLINNGDDEINYTRDASIMTSFKQKRGDKDAGHYLITPEEGQVYSGMANLVDKFGDRIYHPTARPLTAFQKMYCPERSIGGNFRPYWAIGMIERANNRSSSKASEKMWEIHDQLFHDLLAPKIGPFWGILASAVEASDISLHALTSIDKEVLEQPDKLHYKYDSSEVSDFVLNRLVSNIPYETYEASVRTYYKGHLI